jgi:hypothetical protein
MIVSQIRRGNMMASRVKQVRRQVDKLGKNQMGQKLIQGTQNAAGQVQQAATSPGAQTAMAQGASGAGAAISATAAAAYAGATRSVNRMYDLSGQGSNGGNGANGAAAPAGARQWVYVPPLNPGETVTIDVMVGSSARKSAGSHQPFRILSRALGEENAQPVVEEGSIRLATKSSWGGVIRLLIAGVVMILAIAVIWWLASTIF